MARSSDALLTATETFTTAVDGETFVVHAGERVAASSALVKGCEALFTDPGPDVAVPAAKRPSASRAPKRR